MAATLFFRLVLHSGTLYTHFMYVPISFASMWWGVRGMGVAVGLAGVVLSMHALGVAGEGIWNDGVRTGFFLLVAFFIGRLRDMIITGKTALAKSESANRSILESSTIGVLVYRDDLMIFANERLSRLLGWEPGSIVGAPLAAFLGREEGQALGAPAAGFELPRELPLVRRDGSQVWVEAAGSRVDFGGGEAAMLSVTDLTARREAEEKRRELADLARRQEEQLEHSTRLAEMAAAISHELNQPLTGIRNYARNAFYMIDQKAGGEEEVKANLRLISEQVDRAAKIINQMRELTRRSDSTFILLDLSSVIRESRRALYERMKKYGLERESYK